MAVKDMLENASQWPIFRVTLICAYRGSAFDPFGETLSIASQVILCYGSNQMTAFAFLITDAE